MCRWVGSVHRGWNEERDWKEGCVEGKGLLRNRGATGGIIEFDVLLWFGTLDLCVEMIRSDGDLLSFMTTCS